MRRLRRRRQVEGRADEAEEAIAQHVATDEARAGSVRGALENWAEVIVIDSDQRPDEFTRDLSPRRAAHATGAGRARRMKLRRGLACGL
jgi:hypothetical protein